MSKKLYNLLKEIQQHLRHDDDSVKSQQLATELDAHILSAYGWVQSVANGKLYRNDDSFHKFLDTGGFTFEQALKEQKYWEKMHAMSASEKHDFLIKNGWEKRGDIKYYCTDYSGKHFRYISDLGCAFDREIQYQKSNLDYTKVLE